MTLYLVPSYLYQSTLCNIRVVRVHLEGGQVVCTVQYLVHEGSYTFSKLK